MVHEIIPEAINVIAFEYFFKMVSSVINQLRVVIIEAKNANEILKTVPVPSISWFIPVLLNKAPNNLTQPKFNVETKMNNKYINDI